MSEADAADEALSWSPPYCAHDTKLTCPACGEEEAVRVREVETYYDGSDYEAYCYECHAELTVWAVVPEVEFCEPEVVEATPTGGHGRGREAAAMTDQEKLSDFVDQHPSAELHGFFDLPGGRYRCVILASIGKGPRKSEAAEFLADTPGDLLEQCEAAGFNVGSVERVREACETAGLPPRRASERRGAE